MTDNSQNPIQTNPDDNNAASVPSLPDQIPNQSLIVALLRRWYIIPIIFILLFPVSAFLIWKIYVPTYTTTGYILIEPVQIDLLSGEQDVGNISNYDSYLNAQAYKIKSSDRILNDVVRELQDKLLSVSDPEANLKDEITKALEDGTIMVSVPRGNQVIQISMKSPVARDAELVVSAIINAYMSQEDSESGEYENRQITLLEYEGRNLMSSYIMQQEMLNHLVEEQGADSIQQLQSMMYGEQARLQEKISELESRLLDLQVRQSVLKQTPDPNIFPMELLEQRDEAINNDPYVQSTNQTLVNLKQELLVKKQQLPPDDPELENMIELESTLQAELTQYREEAGQKYDQNVVQLLKQKNRHELAQITEEMSLVSAMLDEYRKKAEQNRAETINLGRMDWEIRERTSQMALDKEQYDRIQERIRDLSLQARRPARIKAGGAPITGPPDTKRYSMICIAALLSLALGLAVTFLLARFDKNTRPSLYPIEIKTFIILCIALAIYCFIAARSALIEQNLTAAGYCLIAAAVVLGLPTHALITHRSKKP